LGGFTELSGWGTITKDSKFNTAVTANADIFSTAIEPTYAPSILRISANFGTGGALIVRRTLSDTTVSGNLNSGSPLIANAIYAFDIVVDEGGTINLRYSVNATASKVSIVEVPGGT
jgi:hypothetical protein